VLRGVAWRLEPRALPLPGSRCAVVSPGAGGIRSSGSGDAHGVAPQGAASCKEGGAPGLDGQVADRRDDDAASQVEHQAAMASGYQAGFEQGLQEGRQQGLAEGRQAAEREVRAVREATLARLAKLDQLLQSLPPQLARRLASAEDDLVALCHAIVCRLLGEQLVTREGIAARVRQAIQEDSAGSPVEAGRGPMAIHVHPRDLETLRGDEALAEWLRGHAGRAGAVEWVADERVGPGGCVLRSGEGGLDARLETQMARLRRVLLEGSEALP
jgi:flagellar assembly protein FliH